MEIQDLKVEALLFRVIFMLYVWTKSRGETRALIRPNFFSNLLLN